MNESGANSQLIFAQGVTDKDVKIIPSLSESRVLNFGNTDAALTLASRGAHVIGIISEGIEGSQRKAVAAGVHVEWRETDYADLAFVRADSVDLVAAINSLADIADFDRVLRQSQRVLRSSGYILLSYPHPAHIAEETKGIYGVGDKDSSPIPRSIEELFRALSLAGFAVDYIIEPQAQSAHFPEVVIIRAQKSGQ